jgi:ribonuclease HI
MDAQWILKPEDTDELNKAEMVVETMQASGSKRKPILKAIGHSGSFPEDALKDPSNVFFFTDGACSGNPGPGGWGVVMRQGDSLEHKSGFCHETTNNRMEMTAVVEALDRARTLEGVTDVYVVSDSMYVLNGITDWSKKWVLNGWRTSQKKPVENQAIWEDILELVDKLAKKLDHPAKIHWYWVPGHSGHPDNEMADKLARGEIAQGLKKLKEGSL